MPRIDRHATLRWEGNLARGAGALTTGSGALGGVTMTVASRVGNPDGHTSPEELLAGAHAGCFGMALAGALTSAGTPPERLDVSCQITMDEVPAGGHRIVRSHVGASGSVPGADAAGFAAAAQAADAGCPYSILLRAAGAEVVVEPELGSAAGVIGVIGGSGLYELLAPEREVQPTTPYGQPSAPIAIGRLGGVPVAFLARHGLGHRLPPHRVPYRANLWALREAGVTRILGTCAAGSLRSELGPGTLVTCDQFVDRTSGREHTFFDGPEVRHVSAADPYCPQLRGAVAGAAAELELPFAPRGTVVVVEGPRFSTRAESAWFQAMGWDLVNMTAYPEGWLARELGLCYANVSLVTDYDVGVPGGTAVSAAEVLQAFAANVERLRALLALAIPRCGPAPADDACGRALDDSRA